MSLSNGPTDPGRQLVTILIGVWPGNIPVDEEERATSKQRHFLRVGDMARVTALKHLGISPESTVTYVARPDVAPDDMIVAISMKPLLTMTDRAARWNLGNEMLTDLRNYIAHQTGVIMKVTLELTVYDTLIIETPD